MAGFFALICPGLGHLIIGKPFHAALVFLMIIAFYKAHILLGIVFHVASVVNAVNESRKADAKALADAIRQPDPRR